MEQNGKHLKEESPQETLEELALRARQTEKELEELKRRILELQKEIRRRWKDGS